MITNNLENRQFTRINVRPYSSARIFISNINEGEENQKKCQYTDLSQKGAMIICADPLLKGSTLIFNFIPAGLDYELSFQGVIRWCRKDSNQTSHEQQYFAGIEFLSLSNVESETVQRFLQTLQESSFDNRKKDRRQMVTDIHRRVFNRRTKEFIHEETVYLFDTNAVGNTYFAQHFIWQGKIREAFLGYVLGDHALGLMRSGVKLITREAHNQYYNESILFNRILMRLRVGKVTKTRIELLFQFEHKDSGALVSKGKQIIVFAGANGKPIAIPDLILQGIEKFQRLN